MKFYKITPKNLVIDGLVLGLVFFSIHKGRSAPEGNAGLTEFYWMVLAGGVFLVRWSYFYGENANKKPSLLFKIHRAWVTFCAVASFVAYFIFIFIFLL
jgi:predicted membrane channel-forming protein YqfA (hemolysin III family)